MSIGFYKLVRVLARPIMFLLLRYKLINKNNLPAEGKVLICSNHLSAIDPICIGIGQKRPVGFIAKKELFKNKFLAWFFTKLGAIPIDRDNPEMVSMKAFMRKLKDGKVMGIFIEGTRSKSGEFLEPKEGAALFALQTDSPVLPVCITDIGKRRYIHYGNLITTDELGFKNKDTNKREKLAYATQYIFNKIKELREIDLKNAS